MKKSTMKKNMFLAGLVLLAPAMAWRSRLDEVKVNRNLASSLARSSTPSIASARENPDKK